MKYKRRGEKDEAVKLALFAESMRGDGYPNWVRLQDGSSSEMIEKYQEVIIRRFVRYRKRIRFELAKTHVDTIPVFIMGYGVQGRR